MSVATLPPAQDQSSDQPPHEAWPAWLIPPDGGFLAEDLDRLSGLPPHTELHNGSLIFVSPRANWHSIVIYFLRTALRRFVPSGWRVTQEMSIVLDSRNRPEPDLVVYDDAASKLNASETFYRPKDVLLAIEVESPESQIRDREEKPLKYAEAGIKHYWRIENQGGVPVVNVYRLDEESGVYTLTGVHDGRLRLGEPFEIDIDFAELDDWR